MGPHDFAQNDVYLRTAIGVDAEGWANFGYVKMPDYRWGIFLADADARPHDRLRRRLRPAGVAAGAGRVPLAVPPPDRHPGRHRAGVGRAAAPARPHLPVALRPAQPVPGERRGRPAPVGDGLPAARATSAATAARRPRNCSRATRATSTSRASSARSTSRSPTGCRSSCSPTSPIATASTSCKSLAESGFDPLSRTCRFMLTEEAHHMFVGETGIGRVVKRTLELMKELGTDDPEAIRARRRRSTCRTLQRYLNFWFIVLARSLRLGESPPTPRRPSPTASRAGPTRRSTRTTSALDATPRSRCPTAPAG